MSDEQLRESVRRLLRANIAEGYSKLLGKEYSYIQPSPRNYPYQFWWDTCFHVVMLCRLGEYELAKRNVHSLFAMQEENGFVGHMVFWNKVLPTKLSDVLQAKPSFKAFRPHMSALIQPPLIAHAVRRIYEGSKDEAFLKSMLPKLKKYFHWLHLNRDFDSDGLLGIITPFESGLDWKPSYDPALNYQHGPATLKLWCKVVFGVDVRNFLRRYDLRRIHRAGNFIVKDTLVNTLYAYDLRELAVLCEQLEDPDREELRQRAERTSASILRIMYDEEACAFLDVYGEDNTKSRILTFTIFMPLMLEDIPRDVGDEIIRTHLENDREFSAPYPIPSVAKNDPAFCPNETSFLWRGPSWVAANWLLYRCVKERGFDAQRLAESVKRLIARSGFREYYNPFSGEGYGARDFTWSGLAIDMADR